MIVRRIVVLLTLTIVANASMHCRTASAQKGCAACIQADATCAWCSDPNFSGAYRCDSVDQLSACSSEFLLNPRTEVDREGDRTVGEMKEDGSTKFQLQPQRVKVKLRKGDKAQFDVTHMYLGDEPKNILMLNSEVASQGLTLTYTVICHGKQIHASQCDDVEPNTNITFTATLTLEECKPGDKVVSVGVGGLRDVSALYVTPLCACDCESVENIEYNTPYCSGNGELVCGQCRCYADFHGKKCACNRDSDTGDVESCRSEPSNDVCSGRGVCSCGMCECNDPFTGKYCECDNMSCAKNDNGVMCNGQGRCECGLCMCENDWDGAECECSKRTESCMPPEGGGLCSGFGNCMCNRCHCQANHAGDYCEIEDESAPADEEVPEIENSDVGKITSSTSSTELTRIAIVFVSYFVLF